MTLTNENYYQDTGHFSVSLYKAMTHCELLVTPYEGETSTAQLVGLYVDAYVEGTLEDFKTAHPEIISSRGATKGELKSEFQKAEEICRYIDGNARIQQFLSGEKQRIMEGEIAGVPFKIKLDSYSLHKAIVDLKVMRTVTDKNGDYYDFVTGWGYHTQMACYQEIVRQNTDELLPCFIVAVTKETPINSVIINIPQDILYSELYKVSENIGRFYDIKRGKIPPTPCGKCDTCIKLRKETPIIDLLNIMN